MSETTQKMLGYWRTALGYGRGVMRHWRGNYPVWQAFWFNYLSVSTCLLLIQTWCLIIALYFGYPHFTNLLLGCVVLQSCVWIWALVGAYRAATRDVGGFVSAMRRISAKTFLIINLLAALAGLIVVAFLYHEIVTSFHL